MQELTPVDESNPVARRAKRKKQIAEQATDQTASAPAEMMTLDATCTFFGGDRPLNPSTLYRGVRAGQYPPPVLLGPQNPRWLRSECRQALERLVKERNKYSNSRWLRQADADAEAA